MIASAHSAEIVRPPLAVSDVLAAETVAADRRQRILRTLAAAAVAMLATYVVAAHGFAAVVKGATEQIEFQQNNPHTANWLPVLWLGP